MPRKSAPAATIASARFRAALAVSVDGYIAEKDGGVGWLDAYFSPELDFMGFAKTIGATVMGRATYDLAAARGHSGPGGGGAAIVLTHRPIARPPRGVETFSGSLTDLAAELRSRLAGTGKDVWLMGGGRAIASFHEAGLVDRWELGIIPVLLGDGIPLFPRQARALDALRLVEHRVLSNGIVSVTYEPARPR